MWRVLAVVGFAVLAASCHQNGTVFAVNTTIDSVDSNPGDGACADASGDCSLRAAVIEANALPGVEEIRLVDGETYELSLFGSGDDQSLTGDLDFTSAVVIAGDATVINEGGLEGVFHVIESGGLVEFVDVDVSDSWYALGVEGASSYVSIEGMDARQLFLAFIAQGEGTTFVRNSTATGSSSGLVQASILAGGGTMVFDNFTFESHGPEDGIASDGANVMVRNSTFVGYGSTLNLYADSGGSLSVQSSLIHDCQGEVVSLGHNAAADACAAFGPSDTADVEYPVIGPLDDYGGPVRTFLIPAGSIQHDGGTAAPCGLVETDARGLPRPTGAACDIGAVEIQPSTDCTVGDDAYLRFCSYGGTDLQSQLIRNADLAGANLGSGSAADTDFTGSSLRAISAPGIFAGGANFTDTVITGSEPQFATSIIAPDADFTRAHLRDLTVHTPNGADFTDVSGDFTIKGSMNNAIVERADFSEVYFWNVRGFAITGTPVAMYPGQGIANGWLIGARAAIANAGLANEDLSAFDLSWANAQGALFTGATFGGNLQFAAFTSATLDGADFANTSANGVRFGDASIVGADFSGTNLRSALWQNATIVGSDFTDADLTAGIFTDALVLWSTFDNTTCPSGVNSDDNGGSCDGQFNGNDPLAGAPVPEEFAGMSAADFAPGGVVDD